jgi:hypothetical protein
MKEVKSVEEIKCTDDFNKEVIVSKQCLHTGVIYYFLKGAWTPVYPQEDGTFRYPYNCNTVMQIMTLTPVVERKSLVERLRDQSNSPSWIVRLSSRLMIFKLKCESLLDSEKPWVERWLGE